MFEGRHLPWGGTAAKELLRNAGPTAIVDWSSVTNRHLAAQQICSLRNFPIIFERLPCKFRLTQRLTSNVGAPGRAELNECADVFPSVVGTYRHK